MGKASDWLREERRKVLGDWVAFCLQCGARTLVGRWPALALADVRDAPLAIVGVHR